MGKFKQFADRHPLIFVLVMLLTWMLLGAVALFLATLVLRLPFYDSVPQTLGTIAATVWLLSVAWRFGWLRPAGITSLGDWRVWLVTLITLVYLVFAYLYSFFGEISFDLAIFSYSAPARSVLLRQVIVGVIEEILFRGVLLYALVRVWGRTSRGILASVAITALLFGSVHFFQIFAGSSLNLALLVVLGSFVSGVWWGAYVLRWGSIWPTVVIHGFLNMAVIVKALSIPGFELSASGYLLAILFEIPLVIFGVWLLLRLAPRPVVPDTP